MTLALGMTALVVSTGITAAQALASAAAAADAENALSAEAGFLFRKISSVCEDDTSAYFEHRSDTVVLTRSDGRSASLVGGGVRVTDFESGGCVAIHGPDGAASVTLETTVGARLIARTFDGDAYIGTWP